MDILHNIHNFLFPEILKKEVSKNVLFDFTTTSDAERTPATFFVNTPILTPTNNGISILYNYYEMFSTKIQTPYTGYIHYSISGRENDPNATILENGENIRYIASNFYIFSKIHNITSESYDGELVIKHTPISISNKPLYICFPLKTSSTAKKTVIDTIIENEEVNNLDINFNQSLPLDGNAHYYETDYCKIAVFQTPILVSSSFVGFDKGQLDDLLPETGGASLMIRASSIQNKVAKKKTNIDSNDDWTIGKSTISKKSTLNPYKEGFQDFNILDVSYQWLECDNVDVEYNNEIPTYTVAAGSDNINLQEKTLNITMIMIWFICITLGIIILTPTLFSVLAARSFDKNDTDRNTNLLRVNGMETFMFWILFIPAVVLISYGSSQAVNCKSDDEDCVKKSSQLILPGSILLFIVIIFILSLFVYKLTSPNFVSSVFKYESIDVGLLHLFDFKSAFESVSALCTNVLSQA